MHGSDNSGDDKALRLPSVGAILDNIPGGQENLLPVSALKDPLRVDVPMWLHSNPAPGEPEHLYLYWNNEKIAEKTWTVPVLPGDLFLMVEPRHLNAAGTHRLHYVVQTFNGGLAPSDPLMLTIASSPALGGDSGRLLFDAQVVSGGLTAHYLETHGDKVLAEVPTYNRAWPGDTLSWYWDQSLYTDELVGSRTLTQADTGKAIFLTFEGRMIRERGEGDRFVHYRIVDRAGNNSGHSRPFNVHVVPAPRDLPWPVVEGATGTGKDIMLDPFDAAEGATVVIADTVVIKPNEQLWVQWGEPGSLGAFRTASPIVAGTRRYKIPKREVALNIGKALPVYYEVVGPDGPLRSEIRQLKVMPLDPGKLPVIQCSHVVYQNGRAVLNWRDIPPEGVKLTLKPWPFMMLDQHIWIMVFGQVPLVGGREWVAVPKRPLAAQELVAGVGGTDNLTVPKSWFETNTTPSTGFFVLVYVSFDSGVTWSNNSNFPMLDVELSLD